MDDEDTIVEDLENDNLTEDNNKLMSFMSVK